MWLLYYILSFVLDSGSFISFFVLYNYITCNYNIYNYLIISIIFKKSQDENQNKINIK